jgi:acyl-coenzyme A thioesterase PaaI-like protein
MPKMRDYIDMLVHGEVSPPPIATLLGFTLTSVEPGEAVIAFEATTRHANPMGRCMAVSFVTSPMPPWA